MLQHERLHRIQTLLKRLHRLSTERIMSELNISRETARRDMIELEHMRVAQRVHGGLIITETLQTEAPLLVRQAQNAKEKRAIAKMAIQQLDAGQTVFIDAGSSTAILAEELRSFSGLTILTNSLQVVLNLTVAIEPDQQQHEIILLGGRIGPRACTQGDVLIAEIQRYRADVALLSAVGVSAVHGASSFYPEEACIAQAMQQQSQQLMLLADHSKLDVVSRVRFAQTQDITVLITDREAEAHVQLDEYRQAVGQLILA